MTTRMMRMMTESEIMEAVTGEMTVTLPVADAGVLYRVVLHSDQVDLDWLLERIIDFQADVVGLAAARAIGDFALG